MSYEVIQGDCRDVMAGMDANSVDAIVTDPPYGLSFMGKGWDKGVPGVEFWIEALRVAKPGAYLLAFGGTRMVHRLAVAIEDAGWEIRDRIHWVYGSGFPKSHDVSKAIDKLDAVKEQQERRYRFTEWVRSMGVTSKQIDGVTSTNMGGHYTTSASQPAIMTREHLEACRHLFADVPEWVEREADIRSVESKQFAEREVVGVSPYSANRTSSSGSTPFVGIDGEGQRLLTAPATPEAQQWDGWGTALKPAVEPIILARKPFKGTVASNVLEWGTGGINVDGCRVGDDTVRINTWDNGAKPFGDGAGNPYTGRDSQGRWPANLIHDGSDEVTAGMGDASRYFYCPKASKRDRGENNKHPTVKPTDLMSYLCRLVTPPGGTVLDPFNGSGSTGKAAVREGFNYIGIELDPEYVEIAKARIATVEERVEVPA